MKILIVSATRFEIRPFADRVNLINHENDYLSHFTYQKSTVDILTTGIGMTATAFYLGKLLCLHPYDLAINAGICGSFSGSLKLGEVTEITEENFCELGAEDNDQFLTMFDLALTDPDDPPFSKGKLINRTQTRSRVLDSLSKVRGTTANTIHGNAGSIKKIRARFNPDVESMEGAAFFFSCLASSMPFHEIRSISNFVEERDKSKWNVKLAIKNVNNLLLDLLREIA
jgi:futalosine hydrolase